MTTEGAQAPGTRTVRIDVDRCNAHRRLTIAFTTLVTLVLLISVAMALFGLPPVDLHGPMHRLGMMDPLCGGTRAARFAVQGKFAQAWTYNELGIAAVGLALTIVVRSAVGIAPGSWIKLQVALSRPQRRSTSP